MGNYRGPNVAPRVHAVTRAEDVSDCRPKTDGSLVERSPHGGIARIVAAFAKCRPWPADPTVFPPGGGVVDMSARDEGLSDRDK